MAAAKEAKQLVEVLKQQEALARQRAEDAEAKSLLIQAEAAEAAGARELRAQEDLKAAKVAAEQELSSLKAEQGAEKLAKSISRRWVMQVC